VADTHAVIWYFAEYFNQANMNSERVNRVIDDTLNNAFTHSRIIVPSIVFVEIFDIFCRTSSDTRRIYSGCFVPLDDCPNVEIREVDKEVLDAALSLEGVLQSHEINDKIIVATGAVLESAIITRDPVIHEYARDSDCLDVYW